MVKKFSIYIYNFFFNYPTPSNLTNVWNFGVLSFIFLLLQIASGLALTMYYVPVDYLSFNYVEWIMRDTYFGWYIRYVHANGASLFFFCVYCHLFRSLYYFSYVHPKTSVWNTGVVIFILMIITAFTGYVLPRGQMSYWACTVITNLVTALPILGTKVTPIVWGDFGVSTLTLGRFYTIHFFLPFVILFIMIVHFYCLHNIGSSNGLKLFEVDDKQNFHPYYTWKDYFVIIFVISIYIAIILITPNALAHSDNYVNSDPLVTPAHIVPEWYFLPFYAMLRAVPSKLGGVIILALSLLVFFIITNQVRRYYSDNMWDSAKAESTEAWSINFFILVTKRTRPIVIEINFWIFVFVFIGLGYLGMMDVEQPYRVLSLLCTVLYFSFFFCLPFINAINVQLLKIKGIYFFHFLNVGAEIIYATIQLNKFFMKFLKNFSPLLFKKYVFFLEKIKKLIFKFIIEKENFNVIKNVLEEMYAKSEDWSNKYENDELSEVSIMANNWVKMINERFILGEKLYNDKVNGLECAFEDKWVLQWYEIEYCKKLNKLLELQITEENWIKYWIYNV